jgi:hypothetical protein
MIPWTIRVGSIYGRRLSNAEFNAGVKDIGECWRSII